MLFLPVNFRGDSGSGVGTEKERGRRDHDDQSMRRRLSIIDQFLCEG